MRPNWSSSRKPLHYLITWKLEVLKRPHNGVPTGSSFRPCSGIPPSQVAENQARPDSDTRSGVDAPHDRVHVVAHGIQTFNHFAMCAECT